MSFMIHKSQNIPAAGCQSQQCHIDPTLQSSTWEFCFFLFAVAGRAYDYHDRQVARERSEYPAAKRGRREGSPAYPSYREVSPAPGPMFPTAPRDRYESRVTSQKHLWPCLLKVLVFNLVGYKEKLCCSYSLSSTRRCKGARPGRERLWAHGKQ